MANHPNSKIWSLSKDEFADIVKNSNTLTEICQKIKYSTRGGVAFKTINKRIEIDGLDNTHLIAGAKAKMGGSSYKRKRPLEDILIEHSDYDSTSALKKRLINESILTNQCYNCGLEPKWDNKVLVMALDHINGRPFDHRIENLRLLCPNCHSQTDTYMGRNKIGKYKTKPTQCSDCGEKICNDNNSGFCKKCIVKYRASNWKRKVDRPSKEQLAEEIQKMTWVALGRKYGVSDNAVRKWAKSYNLL